MQNVTIEQQTQPHLGGHIKTTSEQLERILAGLQQPLTRPDYKSVAEGMEAFQQLHEHVRSRLRGQSFNLPDDVPSQSYPYLVGHHPKYVHVCVEGCVRGRLRESELPAKDTQHRLETGMAFRFNEVGRLTARIGPVYLYFQNVKVQEFTRGELLADGTTAFAATVRFLFLERKDADCFVSQLMNEEFLLKSCGRAIEETLVFAPQQVPIETHFQSYEPTKVSWIEEIDPSWIAELGHQQELWFELISNNLTRTAWADWQALDPAEAGPSLQSPEEEAA
jgi:hypothetical protein